MTCIKAKYLKKNRIITLSLFAVVNMLLVSSCEHKSAEQSVNSSNDNNNNTNKVQNSSQNSPTNKSSNKSTDNIRVLTPDWGIASDLTSMGYPPVATGDIRMYPEWVGKPELDKSTIDLGGRYEPNPELMSRMNVDLVIDNDFYQHLRPMYRDIPVKTIVNNPDESIEIITLENFSNQTMKIGEYIGKPEVASQYISDSKKFIQQAGQDFSLKHPAIKKFAVVQFVDTNNLRMYARNSLFEPAFNEMGFQLAALEKGNTWGFSSQKTADLAQFDKDVCLIVIKPFSKILQGELDESLTWQRLGYGSRSNVNNKRCMMILPPTWIYGGMSSIVNVADTFQHAEPININMEAK